MSLTKKQKQEIVIDLKDKLQKQKLVAFVNYKGVTVKGLSSLRRDLKKEGIEFKVSKKTLIDLALKESGLKNISVKNCDGQIALAFGYNDEIAPARLLYKFSKTNKSLNLLGGILANNFIDKAEIINLANLPSRQELLGAVAGTMNAVIGGFVRVLSGNITGLLTVLSKIKK
ncbi:MAG: 50S ribosomal protein L10 [Parcubacteria group bacterium GW2011_GWA2_38_13b]|nr:MAG: 50S ribosomal protein L10 [Parcubacteria group bacterium GW2011_GWA2_38_13b]